MAAEIAALHTRLDYLREKSSLRDARRTVTPRPRPRRSGGCMPPWTAWT